MSKRLAPAELEYLKGIVKNRLESLGPDDDLTRYVQDLHQQVVNLTVSLHLIRGMAVDHNDRPIRDEVIHALGLPPHVEEE